MKQFLKYKFLWGFSRSNFFHIVSAVSMSVVINGTKSGDIRLNVKVQGIKIAPQVSYVHYAALWLNLIVKENLDSENVEQSWD